VFSGVVNETTTKTQNRNTFVIPKLDECHKKNIPKTHHYKINNASIAPLRIYISKYSGFRLMLARFYTIITRLLYGCPYNLKLVKKKKNYNNKKVNKIPFLREFLYFSD